VEKVLAEARKVAEEAEVFYFSSEEIPVHFEANRLKYVQSKQTTSVALRVIKDGRIGYATATNKKDVRNLVDAAVETAQFGMKAEFEFPSPASYPGIETYDHAIEEVSTEDMTGLGEEMIAAVRKDTPDLQCEAEISKSTVSVSLLNSRGGQADYRLSVFGMGVEGQLTRGTDILFVFDSQSSSSPITDTGTITGSVLKQLEYAKNQAFIKTGLMPVIFTPLGVASALVQPLMVGFNGKIVLEGSSPIGNKLGQVVFDKKLSLWDDPTLEYRPTSRPCDDEGVPSQQTALIEKGVATSFLYDLQTAALAGTRSTGNGGRHGGMPSPSPSAFIVSAGDITFDDMIADIREGLVVEQLMGASQGNILGGDFSGNVLLGYKVENGKIAGRVKDTMVSGNIYQLFKDIAAIGSEARWVHGFLNTPPIYLSAVSVASK